MQRLLILKLRGAYTTSHRTHWLEGDISVCLAHINNDVKTEICISGGSTPPEKAIRALGQAPEVKAIALRTPSQRRKPMKIRTVTGILRWVRSSVIAISMGLGALSLQPNAF